MPVKRKSSRNAPKISRNVKITQKRSKRASQKKRGRKASKRQRGGRFDFTDDVDEITLRKFEYVKANIEKYDAKKVNLDEVIKNYIENYKTNIPEALNKDFFRTLQSDMKYYSPLLRAINHVLKHPNLYNIEDFNEKNIGILIRKIKEITTKLRLEISKLMSDCQIKMNIASVGVTTSQKKHLKTEYICKNIRKKILDFESPFVRDVLGLEQAEFDLSPIIFKRRCLYLKQNEGNCATLK